jgi:hypothetical protein
MYDSKLPQLGAIGSVAAPVTLSATLADNTVTVDGSNMNQFRLRASYTPKAGTTNRYMLVKVEELSDDGVYYPTSVKAVNSDVIDIVVTGADTSAGVKSKFPNYGTSTGAANYKGAWNVEAYGKSVKISIAEDGAADFGTATVSILGLNTL